MRNKEGLVDDLITSIPGEWKFDEQVSQHFDTHVRKSVPLYEEVQKAVIEISEWFIKECEIHRSRRKFTNDRDCKKKM